MTMTKDCHCNDEVQREIVVATGGKQYPDHVNLELLQSISLAVSQVRTVDTVLKMIVDGLVERANLALARIWLIGPGDICATCSMVGECPNRLRCLHLAASAGRSQVDGRKWNGIEGEFRRIPLGVRKVGKVGCTGESFLIQDTVLHPDLTVDTPGRYSRLRRPSTDLPRRNRRSAWSIRAHAVP
jgi:hypothetical protein